MKRRNKNQSKIKRRNTNGRRKMKWMTMSRRSKNTYVPSRAKEPEKYDYSRGCRALYTEQQ
jgi:hypothetical protein